MTRIHPNAKDRWESDPDLREDVRIGEGTTGDEASVFFNKDGRIIVDMTDGHKLTPPEENVMFTIDDVEDPEVRASLREMEKTTGNPCRIWLDKNGDVLVNFTTPNDPAEGTKPRPAPKIQTPNSRRDRRRKVRRKPDR